MFGFLVNGFNIALYQPLFNGLVLIYNYLPGHDFGLSIIFLTFIIRLVLYPVSVKALHSQIALQKLQPLIQDIQKKYKDDREGLARETMALYKKEKINPFSGLLLALVQLPILIALYRVFWNGLNASELNNLYSFVVNPGQIHSTFLGLVDLYQTNYIFAVIAGLVQFWQTKMLIPKTPKTKPKEMDIASMTQKQMVYFFPFITILILLRLPSALALYWVASGIFSIVQQYLIFNTIKKNNQTP